LRPDLGGGRGKVEDSRRFSLPLIFLALRHWVNSWNGIGLLAVLAAAEAPPARRRHAKGGAGGSIRHKIGEG
jgi:hypothetical protein